MKTRQRGFTLLELLIVVGVIVIVAAILFSIMGGFARPDAAKLEKVAREHAAAAKWGEIQSVVPVSTDSNDDGYCSVTVTTLEVSGYDADMQPLGYKPVTRNLMCGYGARSGFFFQKITGCKTAMPGYPG